MTRKRPEKKIVLLEPGFSDILVCQKKEFRPNLEVMIQEGENITHENLGTLLGILEINDGSEDSSYIVNYILSVIKKEYFSKGKRGAIESFETALHKANLALSKLAEHGNISWIGKFNALIAVIEKNNLHFSQAGKASALLLRNNILTDISEGMSEEEVPNPLKTFTSLSSGKMEEGDKLILANPEIFDIFSLEEIKKSALRFSKEDFVQFLKTALGNELEKTAVLVVDMDIKSLEQESRPPVRSKNVELNPFSQKAFIPKIRSQEEMRPEPNHTGDSSGKEILNELEEALEKENPAKTKQGHLYIKEESEPFENNKFQDNREFLKNSLLNIWDRTKKRKPQFQFKERLKDFASEIKRKKPKNMIKNSIYPAGIKMLSWLRYIALKIGLFLAETYRRLRSSRKKRIAEYSVPAQNKARLIPDFRKLIAGMSNFSQKQKLSAVIILILIFIVPFFIAKRMNAPKASDTNGPAAETYEASLADIQPDDPTSVRIENISTVFSGQDIQGIVKLDDSFFAISKNSIVRLSDQKNWTVPEDFGSVSKFTPMNDLDVIFLSNIRNRIISFSPISQKFQENSITLPENFQIKAMGTFMTYLYVLDPNSNQIARYPRSEGGFGEKTDWIKESADLSGFENLTVTDSLYLFGKGNFAKFFRGKKENISLEKNPAPENINFIWADENNLYILEKNNGKIIKYDTTGKYVLEMVTDKIRSADNFSVSNDGKIFYLGSSGEISSFSIQ